MDDRIDELMQSVAGEFDRGMITEKSKLKLLYVATWSLLQIARSLRRHDDDVGRSRAEAE
jgi:hypothetical protein